MKNIKIDIKAEDLRKKLNIKDGKEGKPGRDGIDGKDGSTPVINTPEIALQASKLAQVELEKKIKLIEPFKLSDKDIENISLDVQSQIVPTLNKEIEALKKGFSTFKPTGGNTEVFEDGIKVGSGQALNFGPGFDVTHDGHRANITLDALEPTNFTLQAVTDNGATTDNIITVPGIQFDTTTTPATNAEGLLQWNATDGTLDLGMDGGAITMQMGQEMFMKVRNVSGATIPNGTPVYTFGRTGNRPNIYPAQADQESTSRVVGITTQDIASPDDGHVTTIGYVRQIKTNYTGTGDWGTTWATGDLLYVSKDVAGQLTNIEPDAPHHSDIVGTVEIVGNIGIGSILITLDRHKTLAELSDVNGTALTTTGQIPVYHDGVDGYFDFDYNINDYLLSSTASTTYVPYTGATGDVDLGANNFTVDTNTLFVDSTNHRVGIGATAPAASLHAIATTEQLRLGYDASKYTSFRTDSNGSLSVVPGGENISFSRGLASERTVLSVSNAATGAKFDLRAYGGSYSESLFGNTLADATAMISQNDSKFVIGAYGAVPLIFGTNNAERMRIDSSGGIGIGTASPTSPLTVTTISAFADSIPSILAGKAVTGGNSFGASFRNLTGTTGNAMIEIAGITGGSARPAQIRTDSAGTLAIFTGSTTYGTIGTERFSVSATAITSAVVNRGVAGSASSPTYSFTGDTNTGMFWISADTLGFSTNGTEKMRMTSGGTLNIGGGATLVNDSTYAIATSNIVRAGRFNVRDAVTGVDGYFYSQVFSGTTTFESTGALQFTSCSGNATDYNSISFFTSLTSFGYSADTNFSFEDAYQSSANGGSFIVTAGYSDVGQGGNIILTGGASNDTTGLYPGGNVLITAGQANGSGGSAGPLYLAGGAAADTGYGGPIYMSGGLGGTDYAGVYIQPNAGPTDIGAGSFTVSTYDGWITSNIRHIFNSTIEAPSMPTSDPADGTGTLWYDTTTNIVYRGT